MTDRWAIWGVKERQFVDSGPLGLSGFISWSRLADLLQKEEAVRGEKIGHLVIGKQGIDISYRDDLK